jgi:hypothetical protein
MNTPQKTKKQPRKSSSIRKKSSRSVKLIHSKHPVLRHLHLVEHKHTGKLVHFQHTSHLALVGVLVIVGFFLAITQNFTYAQTGTVSVGLRVQGPPPSSGATITSPVDGFKLTNVNPTLISGTCVVDSFVVVYDDAVLAGSTICASDGSFSILVQLHEGKNVLTARNFDNLDQAGPDTPSVSVTLTSDIPIVDVTTPILPDNPVIIPGITTGPSQCEDYKQTGTLQTGGEPHVAVVCVPRTIESNTDHKIGVLVWGGQPPYAINFTWGSGESTLISMDAPGYRAVKVRYASSGVYNINIQVTDKGSKAATGQSAVQVTNQTQQTLTQVVNSILNTSWFETPVPLYVMAVALTLGFWGGDIFQRRFNLKKRSSRSRRKVA